MHFDRSALVVIVVCLASAAAHASPLLEPAAASPPPPGATLKIPPVGSLSLRVLTPTTLELTLVNTAASGQQPTQWNFVNNGILALPPVSALRVMVDGAQIGITRLGFKRRVRYAPDRVRDLRIRNDLYVVLAEAVPESAAVVVTNPDGSLWSQTITVATTMSAGRWSPAVHVNHEGYAPDRAKLASVGYYLGSLGELPVPAGGGFQLLDRGGAAVFSGALAARPDQGSNMNPPPYQGVYQADFTGFRSPGEYRLSVPGLGTSLPFRIDAGMPANVARAYALGLYHQRCGSDNALPHTRFLHGPCHVPAAQVPDMSSAFSATNTFINSAAQGGGSQVAPVLSSVAASLYPFVRTGTVDVRGGHHDAGDYSKYLINSAQMVHHLCFAADNFTGVAGLDNLGLPESGDGKSDVLQLAKWEADYILKMQDADGGFYFLTYPRDAKYEWNVTPDRGYPQVVWPKNTAASAAATAALAQMASSPEFKRQYPVEAAAYLAAAKKGWTFLENAWARYGRAGAYQYVTHYGKDFTDKDEITWAMAEMYLATGDAAIHTQLLQEFNPSDPVTIKWGWWRNFESYGCATRAYGFAASSGRVSTAQLDATMLTRCQQQVRLAGEDALAWTQGSAYGISYSFPDKRSFNAAWYSTLMYAFDMSVANAMTPDPRYLDGVVSNVNYELGSNPSNVNYLTGMGWLRQKTIVSQYEVNARRGLPPPGIPIGSISALMPILSPYGTDIRNMSYPADVKSPTGYGIYDRWTDTWNIQTEIVTCLAARSLATVLPLMAASPEATQPYQPVAANIGGVSSSVGINQALTPQLVAPGIDLTAARVVWEARNAEPVFSGSTVSLTHRDVGSPGTELEFAL